MTLLMTLLSPARAATLAALEVSRIIRISAAAVWRRSYGMRSYGIAETVFNVWLILSRFFFSPVPFGVQVQAYRFTKQVYQHWF
jgi:hypothetical protein